MVKNKKIKKKVIKTKKIAKIAKTTPKVIEEKLGKEIGKITHYFDKIKVAVVEMTSGIKLGDKIRIKGFTTDFSQEVKSMQLEHKKIKEAKNGQAIGLKVEQEVKEHDRVYLE